MTTKKKKSDRRLSYLVGCCDLHLCLNGTETCLMLQNHTRYTYRKACGLSSESLYLLAKLIVQSHKEGRSSVKEIQLKNSFNDIYLYLDKKYPKIEIQYCLNVPPCLSPKRLLAMAQLIVKEWEK